MAGSLCCPPCSQRETGATRKAQVGSCGDLISRTGTASPWSECDVSPAEEWGKLTVAVARAGLLSRYNQLRLRLLCTVPLSAARNQTALCGAFNAYI